MKQTLAILLSILMIASCKVSYTMKDISIPPNVKTIRVQYFENKAGYVNPRLSQGLTDKFRQKVIGQTRLTLTNNDAADYDVSGWVSDYRFSTAGVSNQQSSINRLSVTFHLVFKNTLDESKNIEADVQRSFDFKSDVDIPTAENLLFDDILKNLSDEIFNKIFSNW